MFDDYLHNYEIQNQETAWNNKLAQLRSRFEAEGKTIAECGFLVPKLIKTELEIQSILQPKCPARVVPQNLHFLPCDLVEICKTSYGECF